MTAFGPAAVDDGGVVVVLVADEDDEEPLLVDGLLLDEPAVVDVDEEVEEGARVVTDDPGVTATFETLRAFDDL